MDKIQNARISDLLNNQPTPQVGGNVSDLSEFKSILQDRLKVSSHAQTRLQSRNIELDASAWDRVMQGVDKAAAKGAKESLVLVDNAALVVSIKNRTVITAVDKDSLKDNVFTNIDSAVVV
ncbi:MAG: flagellar protein [Armatimonadetes bacterium]|nr:flagellar protein [Armatimonadota bacterium]MBS1702416.1 flagellar protein [Armatimonadota bacterium]MBS1725844.1 flagellar protein [Armatimonadota bacterium]